MKREPIALTSIDETVPTYGAMSTTMCDHIYVPTENSQVYTSPCIIAQINTPFDVLLAFTACRQSITLQIDEHVTSASALAAPARGRRMCAKGVRLVLMQLDPMHPDYRLFRNLDAPLQLDREQFAQFDSLFDAAYVGQLSLAGSQDLYRGILSKVLNTLPALPPLDARVQKVMHLLYAEPRLTVDQLATHSGLSYDRMSHLFMDELGISIRSFHVWVKLHRALVGIRYGQSLVKLAQIAGFSDAAHLSRVFKQVYGAPPSYFYYSGNVKLIASFAGPIPGTPTLDKSSPVLRVSA